MVVNESLLTGESTPKMKEKYSAEESNGALFPLESSRFVVLSGANVLKVSNEELCTACVVRTGFNTVQGSLMRVNK